MKYKIINLKDIYNSIGESEIRQILKNFKCDLNRDIEYFLKEKSIEFSKQDISRTYIVTSLYKGENVIVEYFAITNKVTIVKKSILSETKRKRLLKFATFDKYNKSYSITLPLIGQLGKKINLGYIKSLFINFKSNR